MSTLDELNDASESSAARSAFEILLDFEKRSLEHVAGMPEQLEAPGLWRGIGFRLGDVYLVSSIAEVAEILRVPVMTSVPGTKAWMLGIANVRGNLLPIVHLRGLLEGEPYKAVETARILSVKVPGGLVGLVVDEVLGQRSFVDENKQDKRTYLDSPISAYLLHEYAAGTMSWGVFSVGSLLRESEFMQAAA
jgi:twitching motility protein PilI